MEKKSRTRTTISSRVPDETVTPYESEALEMPRTSSVRSSGGPAHYIMVVLLIVASFMLGSLYTKVQYLEKGGQTAGTNVPQAGAGAVQPPPADPTVGDVPEISARDHVRGNKNAKVALIEYSDLECPFCKRFHPTMQQVLKEYGDKVMWIWRHYPLDFHVNAQKEAEATECAYELGGDEVFWKFVDTVTERTTATGTGFALDALAPLAAELGLNQAAFKQCLDSGKYTQYVKDNRDGGTKAGVTGTPGTIIVNTSNGKKDLIPGALPFESVKVQLDAIFK